MHREFIIRVRHHVGNAFETELFSEHPYLVLKTSILLHELLVFGQLGLLSFTVFLLAL